MVKNLSNLILRILLSNKLRCFDFKKGNILYFCSMKLSPISLKWILRSYPPFFFQRIWVKKIHEGFKGIDVKIYKSFLNINANKTLFGGSIFSSVDPIYPILLDQAFKAKGMRNTVAWLKSAKIDYLKPGRTNLQFSIRLAEDEIDEAFEFIKENGKIVKTFTTEIYDNNGIKCAVCQNEIYIRDLSFDVSKLRRREINKII